ncbi:MAG: ribbon-helix-helix protein, CopG family [Spirochaetaceae bacterium]|nr:ribbon-helix-helix protein, CopG family [Spirochaetaceae bacterium]
MTKAVVTRFDVEIVERLTELARRTGRTRSYYIKEAVEEKLVDMELIYLAQSRAEDLRAGRSSTVSWEEVKKRNGLSD